MVVAVVISPIALALSVAAADDFSSRDYAGSTGTHPWAGNWTEIGESDGPQSGAVSVATDDCRVAPCLVLESLLGLVTGVGARRAVEIGGATSARLAYHVSFPGGTLVSGSVVVEASVDGGSWKRLHTHAPGDRGQYSAGLPLGDTVAIRFMTSGLSVGARAGIDDVTVELTFPDPTTTTTTTTTSTTTSTATSTSTTTTTSTTSTSTTTTTSTSTTSSTTSTTTTAPTTTTTTSTSNDLDRATTTTEPGSDPSTADSPLTGEPGPEATEQPSEETGVVADFAPVITQNALALRPRSNLLVRFGLSAEDVNLEILGNAVLGVFLTGISLRRLGDGD